MGEKVEEKYLCSEHGNEGNANCKECWKKLKQFAKDKNAYVTGDKG